MIPPDEHAAAPIVPHPLVVVLRRPDGDVLIAMARGRRLTLDAFGTRVWRALARHPTLGELHDRLVAEQLSHEGLADDLAALLAAWRELGLIR